MNDGIKEVTFPKKVKPFITAPKRFNVLEGGRGGSKSWTVAEYFLILGMQRKYRFLCTREVQNSIKDSVHQLLKDKILAGNYPYRITNTSIVCETTGSEFIFHGLQDITSHNLKSLEGIDCCWIEEAQTTTKNSLDILIPTIRKEGSWLVFTMNRMEEMDPVYARFCGKDRDDVCHIKINYYDNPFCPETLKKEAMDCKEESIDDYNYIWEGLPLQQGENKILKLSKVKGAMGRTVEGQGAFEVGVDVARFGSDRTTIFKRHGFKTLLYKVFKGLRTTETANHAEDIAGDQKYMTTFKVDDTGVGGGVTDNLVKNDMLVAPVNNNQQAMNHDKYADAISEMWFEFAKILDDIEIPNDPELLKELCGREYTFDKKGRKQVESKDKFKKRYGKSPDLADGLLLCFYNKPGVRFEDVEHDGDIGEKYNDM